MKRDWTRFASLGLGIAVAGAMSGLGAEAMAQAEWHNCLTFEVFTPEKQAWCDRWQTLQGVTYTVPTSLDPDAEYTTVTLTNGRFERDGEPLFVELVNEPGWLAFGDLNADGKADAAAIFGVALDPEGRAVATYLTAVLDVDGAAQATTPVRLGERILLNGPIAIGDGRITVPFLTMTEAFDRAYVVDGTTLSPVAALPAPLPEGTLVFSQTASYAVRVFTQDGQPRMNLFNRATGVSELSGAPVTVESIAGGVAYRHAGDPAVRIEVAANTQRVEVNGRMLQDFEQVTGTVTYRARMALPPDAVVEVVLVDVSRADAPAVTLASQSIVTGDRQVPIPFVLAYSPEAIDPRHSYAVQARISVGGQLRFINTTRTPVITQNHPTEVAIVVDPVR